MKYIQVYMKIFISLCIVFHSVVYADIPLASNDQFVVNENTIYIGNLYLNDINSTDGGNIWTASLPSPSHGSVTVNSNGTFVYSPDSGYKGRDDFNYTITDVDGDTSIANVYLMVKTPLVCKNKIYQVITNDFKELSIATGLYTIIGTSTYKYNAIGWDHRTNLIYGINKGEPGVHEKELVVIGADGNTTLLGVPQDSSSTDLPSFKFAGDMDRNGNLWIGPGATLYKINVDTNIYESILFSKASPIEVNMKNVADFAYIPSDNSLYGVARSNPPRLYKYDLATQTYSSIAVSGLPTNVAYGAAWTDTSGRLLVSNNQQGGVYEIVDFNTSSPSTFFRVDSAITNQNDGTSCPDARVIFEADLVTVKHVNNAIPQEADTVVYTLFITNKGPSQATAVSLMDNLPVGVTYSSSNASQGSYNSGTGVWTIGNLDSGETSELNITVTIDIGTVGNTIVNSTTRAIGNQDDNTTTGDELNVSLTVASTILTGHLYSDLNGNNSQDGGEPNLSDVTVIVTDSLGTIFSVTTGIDGNYTVINLDTGVASVNIDELDLDFPTGATQTQGSNPTSVTIVTGVNIEENNGFYLPVILDINKTSSANGSTVYPGDIITYTIVVHNTGTASATNIILDDVLPLGVSYNNDANKTYHIDVAGPIVSGANTLSMSPLDWGSGGGVQSLTITSSDIPADATLTSYSFSTAGITHDGGWLNDIGIITTRPMGVAVNTFASGSYVSGTNNNDPWSQSTGPTVISGAPTALGAYEFQWSTNWGPAPALAYNVTDANFTIVYDYVSTLRVLTTNAAHTPTNMITSGDNVTLNAGETLTLSYSVTIDANITIPTIENNATVSSSGVTPISDTVQDNVQLNANLVTVKTVNFSNPKVGDSVVFTITVRNDGPADATNVDLNDALPSGVTLIGASASQGSYVPPTWTIGTLNYGEVAELTLTVTVD